MCKISPCVNKDIYQDDMCWYHWKWGDSHAPTEKKEKKAIKKVSDKRKEELKIYHKEARIFKKENPECRLRYPGCKGKTMHVHHKAGRENKRLLNKDDWEPACDWCHDIATEHSKQAIEQGHSKSRHKKQ